MHLVVQDQLGSENLKGALGEGALLDLNPQRHLPPVGFTTAAPLGHELMEARDEHRLLNPQRPSARHKLLIIIEELGFVPLATIGAELLFEVFSQRYERSSILVTTNLPFDQ